MTVVSADVNNPNEKTVKQKLSFWHACGLNCMFMFGTGPFITIPYCIQKAGDYGPPVAMAGYIKWAPSLEGENRLQTFPVRLLPSRALRTGLGS